MRFKLRTLLIAIFFVAVVLALWASFRQHATRHTIFHSKMDTTIEFPSGAIYRTNRWYSHRPHLDQFEMLIVGTEQFHLLIESDASNKSIDAGERIAEIAVDQKRFKVAVEKLSRNTDGITQYWVSASGHDD